MGDRHRSVPHLLCRIGVQRVEVLLYEVRPELHLRARQVVHLPPGQDLVLHPEGVDQIVALGVVLVGRGAAAGGGAVLVLGGVY